MQPARRTRSSCTATSPDRGTAAGPPACQVGTGLLAALGLLAVTGTITALISAGDLTERLREAAPQPAVIAAATGPHALLSRWSGRTPSASGPSWIVAPSRPREAVADPPTDATRGMPHSRAERESVTSDPAPAEPRDAATYWEPLWAGGRRYRQVTSAEATLLADHVGPGLGRRALDIGAGDGTLARHLHQLGYRTTGIDCAPSAIAAARSTQSTRHGHGPAWRLMDFIADDLSALPDPAYAVVTCRLVYRWMDDKPAFLDRVRHVLAPGGTFWVVTELAGRREDSDPRKHLGITAAEAETLTACWSVVRTADLDVLRCYALRP
jgi:hypothetical protein